VSARQHGQPTCAAPLLLAGHAVAAAVHLRARAVGEEELGLLAERPAANWIIGPDAARSD
jgi:hypothetical protein